MGMFDNIVDSVTNRIKNDIEYKTSSGISNAIDKGAQRAVQGDKTPRCPKCKKAIEQGVKFCSGCGFKLVANCSKCQKDFPFGTKFCSDCGGSLG